MVVLSFKCTFGSNPDFQFRGWFRLQMPLDLVSEILIVCSFKIKKNLSCQVYTTSLRLHYSLFCLFSEAPPFPEMTTKMFLVLSGHIFLLHFIFFFLNLPLFFFPLLFLASKWMLISVIQSSYFFIMDRRGQKRIVSTRKCTWICIYFSVH